MIHPCLVMINTMTLYLAERRLRRDSRESRRVVCGTFGRSTFHSVDCTRYEIHLSITQHGILVRREFFFNYSFLIV
jgi:hypothetical protein